MKTDTTVQILGSVLNMSHYVCPSCSDRHPLFGSTEHFDKASKKLNMDVLGQLPLEPIISQRGDAGKPIVLDQQSKSIGRDVFLDVARKLWSKLDAVE